MLNENQYDLIERFFADELDEQGRADFKRQMQHRAFNEEVKLQNSIRKHLLTERASSPYMQLFKEKARHYKNAAVEENTTSTTATSPTAKAPPSPSLLDWLQGLFQPMPRYAFSMTALVLLGIGSFSWANWNYSNKAIVQEFHEPLLSNVEASQPSNKEYLDQARKAYFANNFRLAEQRLTQISNTDDDDFYEAQSLLAYTYFNLQKYPDAIKQFDVLLQQYFNKLPIDYKDEYRLRWTRLLSYVGQSNTNSDFFRAELNYFLNESESEIYRKKAAALKTKLQSAWRNLVF